MGWLGEIVIGPGLEAVHDVDVLAARREHEHRREAERANLPERRNTVQHREHPIEQDEVDAAGADLFNGRPSVESLARRIACPAELFNEQVVQVAFVFYDQDCLHTRMVGGCATETQWQL